MELKDYRKLSTAAQTEGTLMFLNQYFPGQYKANEDGWFVRLSKKEGFEIYVDTYRGKLSFMYKSAKATRENSNGVPAVSTKHFNALRMYGDSKTQLKLANEIKANFEMCKPAIEEYEAKLTENNTRISKTQDMQEEFKKTGVEETVQNADDIYIRDISVNGEYASLSLTMYRMSIEQVKALNEFIKNNFKQSAE